MKKTVLPLLAALALPAAAHADTIGGNPDAGQPDKMIFCTDSDTGDEQPCTLTMDKEHGAAVTVPAGKVITAFTGYFDSGSKVGLRLMRRNADGTFTNDGNSGYVYADGGVQTFETNIRVPAGSHTVGLDLFSGSVGAVPDSSSSFFASDGLFDWEGTGTAGPATAYDLQLNVTFEDAPKTTTPGGGSGGGSTGGGGQTTAEPSGFTIDKRAVLYSTGKAIEVYARNDLAKSVGGTITMSLGGATGKTSFDDFDYHSSWDYTVPMPAKAVRKLTRKGRLSGSVTFKTSGGTFTQKITAIRGGAAGYDGTYKGSNGMTMVVKRGVITALDQSLNTYCSTNGKFVMRTMMTGLGFPALIAKDGSYEHKASFMSDSFTYKGRLSKGGAAKGYNSLWYSSFDLDPISNKFRAVSCVQASNWTGKRT